MRSRKHLKKASRKRVESLSANNSSSETESAKKRKICATDNDPRKHIQLRRLGNKYIVERALVLALSRKLVED